jgi:glycosyltransferase involved in cell wall biosynthesis
MRIIYDGYIFRSQKEGGINRYFREIISRLPDDWEPSLFGVGAAQYSQQYHPNLSISRESRLRPRRLSRPLKAQWWNLRYIQRANLAHPTYYFPSEGVAWKNISCPVVVTVHDFIHAAFPTLMEYGEATFRAQRTAIERADAIICVSEATKRGLMERFPRLQAAVSVIAHGSSFPVVRNSERQEAPKEPRFLYVGTRAAYKNFAFLLKAFAKAAQTNVNIRLHIAGPPLTPEERWTLHFLRLSDRVEIAVFPSEEALQELYRKSTALLYPSVHEGFGIPPLEAMACGTLPLTSNTTSLPEVLGDAGIMLDPLDESAWVEAILAVADNTVPRSALIAKGWDRAEQFSWASSAAQHIALYQRLGANK